MNKRFENKVAVVTGGNSGIGLATARAFAAEGAKVVITGRSPETLQAAAREIGNDTLALKADVSDVAQIAAMAKAVAERYGRVDVLYVNAGIGAFVPLPEVTEALWDQLIDTNLKGAFFTVQKLLPLMGPGSAIVFCASIAAHFGPATASIYAASKAGVSSLAKSLGAELVGRGIRVNCVSPGLIQTPIMTRDPHADPAQIKAMFDHMVAQSPMKRIGQPEEIAQTVLFLASAQASLITGVDVVVDGGQIAFK